MSIQSSLGELLISSNYDRELLRFANQCAPVICGVKPSNLIMLLEHEVRSVKSYIKNTTLELYSIGVVGTRNMILIYRKQELTDYLKKEKISLFLECYGYDNIELIDCLMKLKMRISLYYYKKHTFPHELGIFLGYPIEDVEQFIIHKGQNFLMEGYWKVYSNVEQTKKLFLKYDKAREYVVNGIGQGKSLLQLTIE